VDPRRLEVPPRYGDVEPDKVEPIGGPVADVTGELCAEIGEHWLEGVAVRITCTIYKDSQLGRQSIYKSK